MSQDVDFAVAILRAAGTQVERTVRPKCRLMPDVVDGWGLQRREVPAWEITVGERSFVVEDPAMVELARTEAPRQDIASPAAGEQLALGGEP